MIKEHSCRSANDLNCQPIFADSAETLNMFQNKVMAILKADIREEVQSISEAQFEEMKIFHKEILNDAHKLTREFDAFHVKLMSYHDISPDKSILKSDLEDYQDCFPKEFDLKKFEQLLDDDYETCKKLKEVSAMQIEAVKRQTQEFLKMQQQAFFDFTLSQQKLLFGKKAEDIVAPEWDVKTPGHAQKQGFDWSTFSKEVEDYKKIRLSITASQEAYLAFGETKEKEPRRFTYVFGGWGNQYSTPKLVDTHQPNANNPNGQWGQPGAQYSHQEMPTLYTTRPRWFEI